MAAMESNSSGLDKLLPKSLTAKRRRRKQKKAQDSEAADAQDDGGSRRLSSKGDLSTSPMESDDTNSNSLADDDDTDDRSFGSYESSAEPSIRADIDSPPARPGTISTHPSQIGYLTTSSPEVQATHIDSEAQSRLSTSASRGVSPTSSSLRNEPSSLVPLIVEPPAPAKVASPDRRSRAPLTIETASPPRTPTASEKSAPAIVNTPPTPTEGGHSSAASTPERRRSFQTSSPASSADGGSGWRNMNTHRRSRSGSINIGPSKLSNIIAAPLTPTPENSEAAASSTPVSSFFSSMFTAAQTAANNLTTNIQNTNTAAGIGGNKKPVPAKAPPSPEDSSVEVEPAAEAQADDAMDHKESAVRTLGAGDLSLSHLGLAEPSSSAGTPAIARFPDLNDTRARSESAPAETHPTNVDLGSEGPGSRPRSLNEPPSGSHTPPQVAELLESSKGGIHRSSSIKSAIKPHRKRGSSVTTGGTIGAAIAAASHSVVPTAATFAAPKLTGFAIASKKRNRDFHSFFKSVPDDDYLIEDYSCALQREILAHGRLYVSEGHLCFSSNILGWTTTLVMSFDEIVSVEKRSTALLFKNGLMISTLHAKHVFASFTSRDATYDLIVNIWKLGHPTLKSTLNGVQLEGTGGDKTEKIGDGPSGETETQAGSESDDDSDEDEEEFYYEEETNDTLEAMVTDTNGAGGDAEKAGTRKVSGMTANGTTPDAAQEAHAAPGGAVDFPGPATHAPTECGDASSHFDRVICDDIIPAPLGKVYSLMFGQGSVSWMSKWLTVDQKCTELQMEDKKGLSEENPSRAFNYIKPLNGSIGPRQTKCLVSESVDSIDFENVTHMSSSTQTPDVPSGNVFAVKTKYCLSWADNNATRVLVTCTIEWSGKSWLKSPIEKGCVDGQISHFKDLFAALKTEVSARSRAPTGTNGQPRMVLKKRGKKNKALQSGTDVQEGSAKSKRAAKPEWGMLEPIRGLAEPLLDIIKPILTGNVMYGLLVGLLVASWFGFGFTPGKSTAPFGPNSATYSADRLAAYEEMWRREDSELWDWLEERVGLGRLHAETPIPRKRAMEPRTVEEKMREGRMDETEMDEAIRVTEEKLKVLKEVVERATPEAAGDVPEKR